MPIVRPMVKLVSTAEKKNPVAFFTNAIALQHSAEYAQPGFILIALNRNKWIYINCIKQK